MCQHSARIAEASAVTTQARVQNYFQVLVRPHLGNRARDEKELYALARAIDTLRSGDLERVADQLAARYLAVETAALEGTWDAAKWLEIDRLEDREAVGPSVMLAARGHQRLVEKAAGRGSYPSSSDRYWGAGDGSSWRRDNQANMGQGRGNPKGKKGKGKSKPGKKGKGSWHAEGKGDEPKGKEAHE